MTAPRPRPHRRVVRPPGTVGQDDAVLRSVLPAAPPTTSTSPGRGAPSRRSPDNSSSDPAVAGRSLDDRDLGWGDRVDDSNDDRLRRDKPPHW